MKSSAPAPTVLIADDQTDVCEALRLLLKAEGYRCQVVHSPQAALQTLADQDFDLALLDLNYARDTTSGNEGLQLLAQAKQLDSTLPVVVMTAWSSVDLALTAMRQGAGDFIQKPWENERLLAIVRNQIELHRALRRGRRLEAENQLLQGDGGLRMIAESTAMRPVLDLIDRVGPSDVNVLLTGENGTGKGVVARALHAASDRRTRPLVSVNMGGFPEGLFESELFGHVKGAFTDAKSDRQGRFELADGGTLFLDEIANVSLSQQTRLLRVLETGEYERVGSSRSRRADVRLISATNADVRAEVAAGRFRQDLLFRLNTVEIHLPPLRERKEDIPLLARHFLEDRLRKYRKELKGFEPSALEQLQAYPWPGNVRELEHVVERAALMARGNSIAVQDLGIKARPDSAPTLDDMSLEEVEIHLIRRTLARCDGNAQRAAEALGLSRSAFYRRLEKYRL
ncbi:MAG: sigma-54-dependent Fis family transcriptional regulator [Verrucomicrobiales bacterium]|nr:sigma-54-dependent Fis family transcriptional regulator [Verrucomicrobiales bacterium]